MPKRAIRADDLLDFIFVGDAQMHPNGDRILFRKTQINGKNRYIGQLWTVDLEGNSQPWTQGDSSSHSGTWTPDGQAIVFLSERQDDRTQLFRLNLTGGEATPLSNLPEGSIGDYRISPDGAKIALTFRPTAPDRTQEAAKERSAKGLSDPPLAVESVWYRLDGDGYFGNQRYALYVFSLNGTQPFTLENADFSYTGDPQIGEYTFDWSPDSKELVVAHNGLKRPHVDPADDCLVRLDATGQAWEIQGLPSGPKSTPRWSPDGKTIAFLGHLGRTVNWGSQNTRLYLISADGGEPIDLSADSDFCLEVASLSDTVDLGGRSVLEWKSDSTGLFVQIGWHGESQLGWADIATNSIQILTVGHHVLTIGSASKEGNRLAATLTTPTRLAEVAVLEPELVTGKLVPKVLTDFNQTLLDQVQLAEPESIWIESSEGHPVQAWIMLPFDYLPPKRIPAILGIHGGPHTQYGWTFFHEFQLLAAQGYAVVYSNPRGSKGYGEAHCDAIRSDWGNKDWEDIQSVTRWMQHHPAIHPGQMGVMGGSYGGYMTNWTIGHCQDFRAAITDRCVSNILSMAGSSDFAFNQNAYFGADAWADHASIEPVWRQSPISSFANVTTPTLVIHSEGDLRCNVEQGEQVFFALQSLGIESRFVRYPASTSHGMSRSGPPDLRVHRLGEIVAWWAKHLS
jgi:dipeptidyl aminopeptidase/acylaminoacyl peptidase